MKQGKTKNLRAGCILIIIFFSLFAFPLLSQPVRATMVTVGSNPKSVAIMPNSAYAYITNLNNDSVSVISTATNTVTATVTGFSGSNDVAVTNAYAYVTNLGSDTYGVGFVSVISTATNTVTSTVTVSYEPMNGAVTPDGAHAYITINGKFGVGSVAVISTATNKVTSSVDVGNYPVGVGVMPNGASAYVVNVNDGTRPGQGYLGNGSVSVISTATNTVISTVIVGSNPTGVALTNAYAYVTNSGNDTVSVISTGVGPQIPAITATASSYTGIHEPLNAIDGIESASNYWGTSAANILPQWLKIDTGFTNNINQVVTHFYDGDARTYTYYIEASADGSSWNTVVPADRCGSGD